MHATYFSLDKLVFYLIEDNKQKQINYQSSIQQFYVNYGSFFICECEQTN